MLKPWKRLIVKCGRYGPVNNSPGEVQSNGYKACSQMGDYVPRRRHFNGDRIRHVLCAVLHDFASRRRYAAVNVRSRFNQSDRRYRLLFDHDRRPRNERRADDVEYKAETYLRLGYSRFDLPG